MSSTADLYGATGGLPAPQSLLGAVRISVTPAPGAVMNADGSRPVAVRISVAASLPSLDWIAAGLLAVGILALAGGAALCVVPARRAASRRAQALTR